MKTVWSRFSGERASRSRRRSRSAPARLAAEGLEPRALLAVTVPPGITSDVVELDDNVLVDSGGGTIEATAGYVQIFGNSRGRIDRVAAAAAADLTITAQTSITVTGAIGAVTPFDSLTLESVGSLPVNLQQSVTLDEDLRVVNAGSFSIGSTVDVGGDLTITNASTVLFAGNVTVDGNLTITAATSVIFAGTLTVGGTLTIANVTGTTRFAGDVIVGGASVTSTTLVQVQAGFTTVAGESAGPADVTFTTDQINLTTASLQPATGTDAATLTIRPRTVSRDLTIASPPGIPTGLNITDADIFAIQPGWKRVVFGDEAAGTGNVKVGSIGSQYGGFSQLLNSTTIAGGSIQVVQPVDATTLVGSLDLIARGTGVAAGNGITIDAPINQTAGERNDRVRFVSHGPIAINAPVWAGQTVSLTTTGGGTVAQQGTAPLTTPNLAIIADGAVTLGDSGNAITTVAITTTNDALLLHSTTGYSIGAVGDLSGITVGTAAATLTSGGDIQQTAGGPVTAGPLSLTAATGIGSAATPIRTTVDSVTATVTGSGGIHLAATGDLTIAAGGLSAPGAITLAAGGRIAVPSGGAIAGSSVTATKEIHWSVLSTADAGVGSLRQVLTNINAAGNCNAAGTDAVIVFDTVAPAGSLPATTVIKLGSQLPDVGAAVTLDGTAARVTLDGDSRVASGLVYRGNGADSVLRGVTLSNFTGFGVQLVAARNVLVDSIVVQSLNTSTSMGLHASGDLTGTEIVGSTFSGGLRGALLEGARNLIFGRLGAGKANILSGNLAAPRQPKFAGTGIRAQGDCSGTVVEGNTFTNNNYGFAFIGARNLTLRTNTFTRNSIAGIYIEGNCAGSSQSANTFGTGNERNRTNVLRAKKSIFATR